MRRDDHTIYQSCSAGEPRQLDRTIAGGLRTLGKVSASEEELDSSRSDEIVGQLMSDDGQIDGPSTAEIDALDRSLVESLEEYVADGGLDEAGESRLIATVIDHIAGARDGWEWAVDDVRSLARGEISVDAATGSTAVIGRLIADMHLAFAAQGRAVATKEQAETWHREAAQDLRDAALSPLDAELVEREISLIAGFEGASVIDVHGDLHIAQFLRAPTGVFVVDFEGEPTRTIDERRQPTSPMRDVACLVRSLDHVARSAQLRVGLGEAIMDTWICFAQEVVLASYEAGLGDSPIQLDRNLLRLFCLEKELYEFVYAARILPEWLYAPQLGMQWLMRDDAAL